jgi:hypothetical protein
MPSSKNRKTSASAIARVKAKYVIIEDDKHPYHLYPPIKADTEKLRELLTPRNFLAIMTEIDKCKYIVAKYYWYCEPDMWIAGDELVFNQNPDKKIWIKSMCTKRRSYCLCDSEDTHEFISVCPKCRKLSIMCKDTVFHCKKCDFHLSHDLVNDMPYAKLRCDICPALLGWEKAEKIAELIRESLKVRSHVIAAAEKENIEKQMKELTEDVKE